MTAQMQRRIRERWQELVGSLTLESRRHAPDPTAQMEVWKLDHTRRITDLLTRGVRLRKIRTHGWDDPRATEHEFAIMMRKAVNNLRKRNRAVPPKGLAKFRH